MAKTLGYMRQYRADRKANKGLPLSDPTSPHQVFGPGHAATAGGFSGSVRPRGRAPRGRGDEYAARRSIANAYDANTARIGRMERKLMTSRGLVKHRHRDTLIKAQLPTLKRFNATIKKIVRAPGGWKFKAELIKDIRVSLQKMVVH